VGSLVVVLLAPAFDDAASMIHGDEPVLIEALIAELAIEALDVGVLDWLAWTDERQSDVLPVRPGVERLALELGAVIHGDRLRASS
jgi:hypothetical protein